MMKQRTMFQHDGPLRSHRPKIKLWLLPRWFWLWLWFWCVFAAVAQTHPPPPPPPLLTHLKVNTTIQPTALRRLSTSLSFFQLHPPLRGFLSCIQVHSFGSPLDPIKSWGLALGRGGVGSGGKNGADPDLTSLFTNSMSRSMSLSLSLSLSSSLSLLTNQLLVRLSPCPYKHHPRLRPCLFHEAMEL
jgi:hypothetical protein